MSSEILGPILGPVDRSPPPRAGKPPQSLVGMRIGLNHIQAGSLAHSSLGQLRRWTEGTGRAQRQPSVPGSSPSPSLCFLS